MKNWIVALALASVGLGILTAYDSLNSRIYRLSVRTYNLERDNNLQQQIITDLGDKLAARTNK
jgi:hypothetical protein